MQNGDVIEMALDLSRTNSKMVRARPKMPNTIPSPFLPPALPICSCIVQRHRLRLVDLESARSAAWPRLDCRGSA